MRFLLDQDVYALTARFLAAEGHDVVTAIEAGLSQASDSALLVTAREQSRVLVTRDRDFGEIVFVKEMGTGVIYSVPHNRFQFPPTVWATFPSVQSGVHSGQYPKSRRDERK